MPPQKTPSFDVAGARKAGYSDDEILSHLTQSRKFDVQGALKSGYSKSDLIGYLSTTPSQALDLPGGQPGDADYATNQAQDVIKKQASGMRTDFDQGDFDSLKGSAGRSPAEAISKRLGDNIASRDNANLKRAAAGQPLAPNGPWVDAGPRMVKSAIDKTSGLLDAASEHPILAAAQLNPITGIPANAIAFGKMGADLVDNVGDIAKNGFTADNADNLFSTGANTALAGAGFGGQLNELRNVPIDAQNEFAQRGLKPAGKGQQQFQDDIEGARPYLGGKGINSQSDLQAQLPGAKNEVWAPYDAAMQRIGQQPAQGPNGPTTYGELEARRAEISAQLHAVHSKDDATLQTILQQGKTPADLEAESTAIKAVLDPRLQAEGINPLAIRNTEGNIKGINRLVSGRNTISEDPQKYVVGRYLSQMKLTEPSTWLPGYEVANDLRLHRPLWSGKPTDVDIKTGLLSGAEKPDFTNITYPQPIGPQPPLGNSATYGAPTPTTSGSGTAPPPVQPQFALEGIGRPTNAGGAIPTQGRNVNAQVTQLPTQHPGNGDYAGLLPGPPAPFVPPAPRPPVPQVGTPPRAGFPPTTPNPMWEGGQPTASFDSPQQMIATPPPNQRLPFEPPAPTNAPLTPKSAANVPPGSYDFHPPLAPPTPSLTLPGGTPPPTSTPSYSLNDIPAQAVNPQEVLDLQEETPQLMNADRVNAYLRDRAVKQNIDAGLGGNRRDMTGETREANRARLEVKGKRR